MQKTIVFNDYRILFILIIMFGSLLLFKQKVKFRDLVLVIGLFIFGLIAWRNTAYIFLFYPTFFTKILFENINFSLKNRKARRNNKDVAKYIDLYKQDLLNIENITVYLK